MTITGADFTGATAVRFGSNSAARFTVNLDSSITAITPPGTDTVDVTVTTPRGTSPATSAGRFAYRTPAISLPPYVVHGWAHTAPTVLPRSRSAAVALTTGFSSAALNSPATPELSQISIELARSVMFDTTGLPAARYPGSSRLTRTLGKAALPRSSGTAVSSPK